MALKEFWNSSIPGIKDKEELKEQGVIIQFGVSPNRIDLLNYIDGVEFKTAWKNRKTEHIFLGIKKFLYILLE
ncbi:MAG: hypothetical protein B6D55_03710 [Candidatus Omnitrophica bacterium 4484_70.2]|nr:MAG: hypothetical protein B6D55_03710 [Candidatus Omnitrophica bacterium 4484_70.2]